MGFGRGHLRICLAAGVAVAVLIAGGVGYRLLAVELARPSDSVPLPAGTLARLPLNIGAWRGEDVPIDPAVAKATDLDQIVNRSYHRPGNAGVSLFFGYGLRGRDLMPHRPEVCYTGSGWVLAEQSVLEVPLADGSKLPCSLFLFRRGAMGAQTITVLSYFIVDGMCTPDVSLLRWRVWRGAAGMGYMARVMITSQGNPYGGPEQMVRSAREAVLEFTAASAAGIRCLMPDFLAGGVDQGDVPEDTEGGRQ